MYDLIANEKKKAVLFSGFPLAIAIVANGDNFEKMAPTFQIWRFSNHPTEI